MKINFKGFFILLIFISLLIFSLGFVSASNDSNDLSDIKYDDNGDILVTEDSDILNDYANDYANDNIEVGVNEDLNDNDIGIGLNEELNEENIDYIGAIDALENNDNSISNQNLKDSGEKDFKDIQKLIDDADENDIIPLSGKYCGNSKIILNKTLTLKGDSNGAILDGGFLTQILEITSSNVVLSNLKFVNSYGLSVNIESNGVTVDNCSFENSINGELGSALKVSGNNIKIFNSNFLNNIANKSSCHHTNGPAIYLIGDNAQIENCSFINNTGYNFETASSGGAIWLRGSGCSLVNSIFKDNKAISKFAWTLHSEEQTYLACGYGGAVYWVGNYGKIINCSFSDCISHTNAGALYIMSSNGFSIINSSFKNNLANSGGGAIYLGQNVFNLKIIDSGFEENVALGLNGVITPYPCFGGAIYSSKFVENISISNSSFLNNYGESAIYYLGSNLTVNNSLFDMPNLFIDNSTLEGFLAILKNSTFEECCLTIEDFSLYDFNGALYGTVNFTNGSLENNYWGSNFKSADGFNDMKLIMSNGEYFAPNAWINLAFAGLNYLTEKGIYEYKFRFVLNDDSDVLVSLPYFNLSLEHSIENNLLSSSSLCIRDNYANVDYSYVENGLDNLIIKNAYDKLLDSINIICGAVYVEDSGNDTIDIQNAIDSAEDGSVIVLQQKEYVIDTININKNIVLYSNGGTFISSLDSKVMFNIVSKEENPNLTKVEINGLNFFVDNGNVIVSAKAINDSNADLIDIPNIVIKNNTLIKLSYDVVSESVTVLKLSSPRAILATTSNISIIDNNLIDGVNTFVFDLSSVVGYSDVSIVNGSIIPYDSKDDGSSDGGNKTVSRNKSVIVSKDMACTTVYSKDGKIGKYFTIRLTDSNSKALTGKRIIINFNGKTYYRTTDKNGFVRMQINLAKKGTYDLSICFLGDENYGASFKANKIKVNPVKAKLKVVNSKFKKSSKKKTLSAKFLSPKGKAVKGKKISFKINGKTYTAKTNSKGVATVKVKLNKRKTYKFTAKFAGDNTFKAISVKGKAIVK